MLIFFIINSPLLHVTIISSCILKPNCSNLIVVMDKGHVVEMGNHKELLDKQGVYEKLYQTQYKGLDT